jgi:hypothetical protein
MKKLIGLILTALVGVFTFVSCDLDETPTLTFPSPYPHLYHKLEYIGIVDVPELVYSKDLPGIIDAAMIVIFEHDSDESVTYDGVTYEIKGDLNTVTGGVPARVFNQFATDLKDYYAGVGSVWQFVYCLLSDRGAEADVYIIYYIKIDEYSYSTQDQYMSLKGKIGPK